MKTADGVEVTDDDTVYCVADGEIYPMRVGDVLPRYRRDAVSERYSTKQAAVAAWIAEEDWAHEIRKARLLAELNQ